MTTTTGWRILLRSLLVQSSWNFAGLQNLGFFFMTWPVIASRRLAAPELARAGLRQQRTFNTHPYFAGLVAATVMREEERGGSDAAVDGLKNSLMCALGAVGDEFFWATLRPFAAVLALPAALAGAAWAPLLMLALYNVPHVGVRVWGIGVGLRGGGAVIQMLQRQPFSRSLPALGTATAVGAGFIAGSVGFFPGWGLLPGRGSASAGAAVAVFLALLAVLGLGFGQGRLLLSLSALTALAGAALVAGAP